MSQELERARKAAIANRMIRYTVCFGLPLLGFIFGMVEEGFLVGVGVYILFCGILSSLWAFLVKNKALAQYRALFKKEMIELALNGGMLYENMEYQYDAGINPQIVNGSGLLTTDRFYSDCYISATYNGVKFIQADIRNVNNSSNGSVLEARTLNHAGVPASSTVTPSSSSTDSMRSAKASRTAWVRAA